MTPFASWPRWLQTLTLALVLAFTYLALLLGQGWGTPDVAAARSPLAARFEASPQDWLRHPLELSVFEADLAARRVREVGVDGARVLVTRTDGGRYSTTLLALPGDAGAAARLGPLSREQGFALTALALDGQGAASRWGNRAGVALERLLLLMLVVGAAAVVLHRVRTGSASTYTLGALDPVTLDLVTASSLILGERAAYVVFGQYNGQCRVVSMALRSRRRARPPCCSSARAGRGRPTPPRPSPRCRRVRTARARTGKLPFTHAAPRVTCALSSSG